MISSEERIKLIYEFNEHSPLFARVASIFIEKGNINDAIRILKTGIVDFPSYPTAYFILALAYAYSGDEEESLTTAAVGRDLLGVSSTYNYYEEKIQKIISERNALSETARPAFFSDELTAEEIAEEKFEDRLDLLAEQLSKAKIVPKENDDSAPVKMDEFKADKIISDTMAEIFISQRKFNEALEIYNELLKQKPEKAGIYLQKISDLNSMME